MSKDNMTILSGLCVPTYPITHYSTKYCVTPSTPEMSSPVTPYRTYGGETDCIIIYSKQNDQIQQFYPILISLLMFDQ